MAEASIKSKVKKWVTEIGQNEAYIRLLRAGISRSTADKLVFSEYPHEPKGLVVAAINKAMGKAS